ncbi:MAG: ATP-binding protein, partial [Gemmatimonadaceae bacterium]|nr:ATP-binding protein [Gemmatimonadaceae bacterium]
MRATGLRTIRGRLAIGVVAATLIGISAFGGAWTRLERLRDQRAAATRELRVVSERARAVRATAIAVMTNGLRGRRADEAAWLRSHLELARAADTLRHALLVDPRLDDDERALLAELGRRLGRVEVVLSMDRTARALADRRSDDADFDTRLAIEVGEVSRLVDTFSDHVGDRTMHAVDAADAAFVRAVRLAVVIAALAGALAFVVLVVTLRAIVAPIDRLAGAVLALGRGQIDDPALDDLEPRRDDEFGPLHEAVRSARDQLRRLLARARLEADRNRAIVDTALVGIVVVDAGGRILIANPAIVAMTGRSLASLTGTLFGDVFAPDSLRIGVDTDGTLDFDDAMRAPRFNTRVRLPGSRAFPAEVAITALPVGGLAQWVVFIHDLTEKHAAERALEEARLAAESASRTKSAFLARMSHELRTPLNSIIGFTRIVRRSRDTTLGERDRLFMERIQTGGEHLLSLVDDLLDLSRIEAGKVDLVVEPVDVAQLARDVLPLFEAETAERPVTLDLDLPDGPAMTQGDAGRLRQILVNLIGNAVKFTPRGAVTVIVRADPVSGTVQSLAVHDTGIGIALDRQARIFDAFEQAEG